MTKKVQDDISRRVDSTQEFLSNTPQANEIIRKTHAKVLELLEVRITPLGGNQSVTGSSTRVDIIRKGEKRTILVDLGLLQSGGDDSEANKPLMIKPDDVDALILTHTHIDHIGKAPQLLNKENIIKVGDDLVKMKTEFKGTAYTSHVGVKLMRIMLDDSVNVMEKENMERLAMLDKRRAILKELASNLSILKKILSKEKLSPAEKKFKQGLLNGKKLRNLDTITEEINKINKIFEDAGVTDVRDLDAIFTQLKKSIEDKILYTSKQVDELVSMTKGTRYGKVNEILPGVKLVFHRAEHVFGSCIATIILDDGKGGEVTLGFSGDMGRFYDPKYLTEPDIPPFQYDFMMIESTYGGREHVNRAEEEKILVEMINAVYKRKGKIIIPAFMLQRLQDVGNLLVELQDKGLIPKEMKIYFDGGSTELINNEYRLNDKDGVYAKMFAPGRLISVCGIQNDSNPFILSSEPAIMLAPSGMYTGGSVTKYNKLLEDKKNLILFPGFVSEGSPGREIVNSKLKGKGRAVLPGSGSVLIDADVYQMKSLSSHGDKNDLLYFLNGLNLKENAIITINHGEEPSKMLLMEDIIANDIIKKEHVHATGEETRLSFKKPFLNWIDMKPIKKAKKALPKTKKLTQESRPQSEPELNQEKFEDAIRVIVPNELYRISTISKDRIHEVLLGNREVGDSYILNRLIQSNDPVVRDFMENPFICLENADDEKSAEKNVDEKLVHEGSKKTPKLNLNLKELKERRTETSISVVITKLNKDTYSGIIRNENGEIIYKTNESDFDAVHLEIKKTSIIPEGLQLNKKSTNIKLTKDFFNSRLPNLEKLMKQKSEAEDQMTLEFIELKFQVITKGILCKVVYKKDTILEIKNNDKDKIISSLKKNGLITGNFRRADDRIMLDESSMAVVIDIVNNTKAEQEKEEITVKKPKAKKSAIKTQELPKRSKRHTGEKLSRRRKKLEPKIQ